MRKCKKESGIVLARAAAPPLRSVSKLIKAHTAPTYTVQNHFLAELLLFEIKTAGFEIKRRENLDQFNLRTNLSVV